MISMNDKLRPNAKKMIENLKKNSVLKKTVMLTGDIESKALEIAKQLGIDEVHANMKPTQKKRKLFKDLKTVGLRLLL